MTISDHKPDTAKRAHARDFQRILDQQPDIGTAKVISGWFLDPRNIFDPNSRRRPKPEVLIILAYLLLMAAAFAAFNFR